MVVKELKESSKQHVQQDRYDDIRVVVTMKVRNRMNITTVGGEKLHNNRSDERDSDNHNYYAHYVGRGGVAAWQVGEGGGGQYPHHWGR